MFGDLTSALSMRLAMAMDQAMGTTGNTFDPDVVPDKVTTDIDYVRIWK